MTSIIFSGKTNDEILTTLRAVNEDLINKHGQPGKISHEKANGFYKTILT